jgi:hypothetical protein
VDLDPIAPRSPEEAIPRPGPERVLHAQPSAENLRGSAPGLLLVGIVMLSLGIALTWVFVESESYRPRRTTARRVLGYVAAVLMPTPLTGYGLVCLARAARMRREARRREAESRA